MTKIKMAVQPWYLKPKRTKLSQTCVCLLLFAALFNFGGCKPKPGPIHPRTVTATPVLIANCYPQADPIVVKKGSPVTWTFSDNTYSITFEQKYDLNVSPPLNITPPSNSISVSPGSVQWDTSNAYTDCSIGTTTGQNAGCYYKYSISVGNKVCNDPGVHVIPGGP